MALTKKKKKLFKINQNFTNNIVCVFFCFNLLCFFLQTTRDPPVGNHQMTADSVWLHSMRLISIVNVQVCVIINMIPFLFPHKSKPCQTCLTVGIQHWAACERSPVMTGKKMTANRCCCRFQRPVCSSVAITRAVQDISYRIYHERTDREKKWAHPPAANSSALNKNDRSTLEKKEKKKPSKLFDPTHNADIDSVSPREVNRSSRGRPGAALRWHLLQLFWERAGRAVNFQPALARCLNRIAILWNLRRAQALGFPVRVTASLAASPLDWEDFQARSRPPDKSLPGTSVQGSFT